MNDDLISRSAVTHSLCDYVNGNKTIGQCIDDVPTAYDLDKVVEQLEKKSCILTEYDEGGWCVDYTGIKTSTAIDIVKAGGVNE